MHYHPPSWSLGSICWNRFQKIFCRKCIFFCSAHSFHAQFYLFCGPHSLVSDWQDVRRRLRWLATGLPTHQGPLCQYVQMNHDYHLAKIEHTPEKFSWPCSTKWVPEHTKRSPRSGQGSHHISESSWKEYFWNFFLVSPTIFAGK